MLTDLDVKVIVEEEIRQAIPYSELSGEREAAIDFYNGKPYAGDDDVDGSKFVTREVLEKIESAIPQIMRVLVESKDLAVFEPVGPEDEELAEQESKTVSHIYWDLNDGFYNTLSALKDGLLEKVGYLKVYWEDTEDEKRESYEEISLEAMYGLIGGPDEKEIIDYEEVTDEFGQVSINVSFLVKTGGRIVVEPVPPEEVLVGRNARSPYADELPFIAHRILTTRGGAVKMGFDKDTVDMIPLGTEEHTEESRARDRDREENYNWQSQDWSRQNIWITESYIEIDRDEDGLPEMYKVVTGSNSGSSSGSGILLSIDDWDDQPFCSWTPVLNAHRFHGMSIADMLMDIQRGRSEIFRNMLDNSYHVNNQGNYYNDRVDPEDLLSTEPGHNIHVRGIDPVGGCINPIPTGNLSQSVWDLYESLNTQADDRTGISDETAALDPGALANVNTGVAMIAYDAKRAKLEMIAQMFAELLISTVYRKIHKLATSNNPSNLGMRINDQWMMPNPAEWKSRDNLKLRVGLGSASREKRLMTIKEVIELQQAAIQSGGMGTLVTQENIHHAMTEYTEALGEQASLYWTDPATVEPPPPQPDPQMEALKLQAEIEHGKLQVDQQKLQIEAAKVKLQESRNQAEEEIKTIELGNKEREIEMRGAIEKVKAEGSMVKTKIDEQSQIMNAEANQRRAELQAMDDARKADLERMKVAVDKYKAELDAMTEVYTKIEAMGEKISQVSEQVDGTTKRIIGEQSASKVERDELSRLLQRKISRLVDQLNAPIDVERDIDGRIVRIGQQRINQ